MAETPVLQVEHLTMRYGEGCPHCKDHLEKNRCTVCGTGLCEVQRYDRRKSNLCVDKIGVFNAEEAGISLHQCLLRTDEAKH